MAVGGYGRSELAPYSDLDVVLVHDDAVDVAQVAGTVWYPLWDAGAQIDHSVRRLSEVTAAARDDPRVALGLLDTRHLAGDPNLTLRLRADLLAHWRRDARRQLPLVREMVEKRAERMGELAHASVPDLKESLGGLRDATVLKALVATWLVDVPHADLERCRMQLLDIRDELHAVVGRASDRVAPEAWTDLAARLGLDDGDAAQRQVRELGRRITHLSRLTWRRVDAVLARPATTRPRAPELERVARGVAVSAGEVVLDARTDPAGDPALLLRAAAEASERGLVLSPATAARLARDGASLPEPWDDEARNLLTRLLAGGPGLLAVWETLDETGALARILPEWERVRLLPHASVVHRFTVDRHMVETCIEASRLIRRVGPPRRADGRGAAARHRQGRPPGPLRRRRARGGRRRDPARLRRARDRPGRPAGALAPAARRDGHHPRPRGPRDRRPRGGPGRRRRDPGPAGGADRGRRPGHRRQGLDHVAGGAGRRPGATGPRRPARDSPRGGPGAGGARRRGRRAGPGTPRPGAGRRTPAAVAARVDAHGGVRATGSG